MLYSLSLMCNVVVMVVYWSILHKEQMEEYKDPSKWGHRLHLKVVHSLPGVCCLLNFYASPIILKKEFWKIVAIFCFLYGTFANF